MLRASRVLLAILAIILAASCGSKSQPQPRSPVPASKPSDSGATIDLGYGTGTTVTFRIAATSGARGGEKVASFECCLRVTAGIDIPFTVAAQEGGVPVRFLNFPLGTYRLYAAAKDRAGQYVHEENQWSGYALVGSLTAEGNQSSVDGGVFSILLKGEDPPVEEKKGDDPVESTLANEYSACLETDANTAVPLGRVSFSRSPWDGGYALTATLRNANGMTMKTAKLYFDEANVCRAVGRADDQELLWLDATPSALQSTCVEWDERGIAKAIVPVSLIPDDILNGAGLTDSQKAKLTNAVIHLDRITRDPMKGGTL